MSISPEPVRRVARIYAYPLEGQDILIAQAQRQRTIRAYHYIFETLAQKPPWLAIGVLDEHLLPVELNLHQIDGKKDLLESLAPEDQMTVFRTRTLWLPDAGLTQYLVAAIRVGDEFAYRSGGFDVDFWRRHSIPFRRIG